MEQLKYFLQNDEKTILKFFSKSLKAKKYKKIICTADYLVAVGDIPIALTAHLDTVFKQLPQEIYFDQKEQVMWSPDGLGADDKVGVWMINSIINAGYKPTIILTTDEEKGNIGALKLVADLPQSPAELKYIIELDRRGKHDSVYYDCANAEFEKYINSFGFITARGSFSDISVICPTWGVAGVNLSVGYYFEHSYCEMIKMQHAKETYNKVLKLLKAADKAAAFKYEVSLSNLCAVCQRTEGEIPIKDVNNKIAHLCLECVAKLQDNIEWCYECGHAFTPYRQIKHMEDIICQDCERDKQNERY